MLFHVTIAVLVASAQAKFYTDCGSKLTNFVVGVTGCTDDMKECVVLRNTNVTTSFTFSPTTEVKGLWPLVHGIVMNKLVPFPLPQPDGCKDSGITCPIKAGSTVTYKFVSPILNSYPALKTEVKWELQNEKEENLICAIIHIRVSVGNA